ncbi:hypothetical protein E2320_018371, partial [Naja naja]
MGCGKEDEDAFGEGVQGGYSGIIVLYWSLVYCDDRWKRVALSLSLCIGTRCFTLAWNESIFQIRDMVSNLCCMLGNIMAPICSATGKGEQHMAEFGSQKPDDIWGGPTSECYRRNGTCRFKCNYPYRQSGVCSYMKYCCISKTVRLSNFSKNFPTALGKCFTCHCVTASKEFCKIRNKKKQEEEMNENCGTCPMALETESLSYSGLCVKGYPIFSSLHTSLGSISLCHPWKQTFSNMEEGKQSYI